MQPAIYPVQFSVDYPDRPLDRLTTFFRLFVAIPILIVLGGVSGGTWQWSTQNHTTAVAAGAGGLLFFAPLLMILFRQKYPRWWFDWNLELLRFSNRVGVYLALMDDRYPSTDEQQAVHLDYPYPDAPARPEPLAPAGQVVPGDPALRRPVLPVHRRGRRRDHRVVRHPVHRTLPTWTLRLRRGRHPLAQPRGRLCPRARHRPVPALPPVRVTSAEAGRRASGETRCVRRTS